MDSDAQLQTAWQLALRYDADVLAERWIEGEEYTAAVLGEETLPLIRLETPNLFYDYEAKYEADTTRYLIPCGLPEDQESRLQEQSLAAFNATAASGRPWFIEVNTVPGLTDHSLVPMAARAAGMDFTRLVSRILETTLVPDAGTGGQCAEA